MFRGVPSFAPEILRRVKLADAMKAKKLREALQQMAEEGVVQVFLPHDGAAAIVGVVGALQLDVLTERLNAEYGLPVSFEPSRFEVCRWVSSPDEGGAAEVPRRLSVLDRLRPRRRAGVHGLERLQPALRAGALAEDRLHGRQGLPEGGGLEAPAKMGAGCLRKCARSMSPTAPASDMLADKQAPRQAPLRPGQ